MGKRSRRRWRETESQTEQPAGFVQLSLALVAAVGALWQRGWQPADVARVIRRHVGRPHERLLVEAIAADARSYTDHPHADPRWLAQLDALGARRERRGDESVVGRWARQARMSDVEALRAAAMLLELVRTLGPLAPISVPPHQWSALGVRASASGLDAKMLERVRALLAKAESTTFPPEAEALTAKAQQLMARHSIDQAVVSGGAEHEPSARRIGIDDPYARAKSMLLSEVAGASRCRAVWGPDFGFSTVFGFDSDLDAVELLFTSLLVQATTAMMQEGDSARRRTRSFRQSFLVGFAVRIGQRLREATAEAVEEAVADHGESLLPVLAQRDGAVDDALAEAFPELGSYSLGANDAAGRMAGTIAADRADLAVGPAVDRAS